MDYPAQAELLFNRLAKRYRHLKKWARRTGTNAFRLYDRDIPEIPLVLDLYGDAVSGAVYRKSCEKEETEAWLSEMKAAASRALDIPERNIFLKERRRMSHRREKGTHSQGPETGPASASGAQYSRMSRQNFYRDVREGDLLFRVNLSDYLDTGLFLDARKKRAIIRSEASGKRVLNLFAYTCSLSVAAAKGNAVQVDSVDLSKTYLDWGKINFALNRLEDHSGFTFVRGDVTNFLTQAAGKKSRWDLIILDPPSFSNSKRVRGALDLRRDHQELISRSLTLLSPGGTLWFSSNARGLALESGNFPGLIVKDLGPSLVDEDFKGKRIPSCYTLIK